MIFILTGNCIRLWQKMCKLMSNLKNLTISLKRARNALKQHSFIINKSTNTCKKQTKNVNQFDVIFLFNIPETEIILTNAKLVGATSLSMLNMTCKIAMLLVFRALDSSLKTVCFKRVGMFSLWALHNSRMHWKNEKKKKCQHKF